ncbi:MAG: alpha/beta fold hydrolase [Alphaproteobacteria bacterium]
MNKNQDFATFFIGKNKDLPKILWLHGWGHSHKNFLPMAEFFDDCAYSMLVDFPGFGESKNPPADWGSEDYMDALYQEIIKNQFYPAFIIGHSFGCRVAIRLAAKYPDVVQNLVLISAAGLKRKRSLFFKTKAFVIKTFIKTIKLIDNVLKTDLKSKWSSRLGSSDYKNAGELRNTFVKVISENLAEEATHIKAQTLLVFGDNDQQTPVDFGIKYHSLIENSELLVLKNQDHFSVLTTARSQVISAIKKFLRL